MTFGRLTCERHVELRLKQARLLGPRLSFGRRLLLGTGEGGGRFRESRAERFLAVRQFGEFDLECASRGSRVGSLAFGLCLDCVTLGRLTGERRLELRLELPRLLGPCLSVGRRLLLGARECRRCFRESRAQRVFAGCRFGQFGLECTSRGCRVSSLPFGLLFGDRQRLASGSHGRRVLVFEALLLVVSRSQLRLERLDCALVSDLGVSELRAQRLAAIDFLRERRVECRLLLRDLVCGGSPFRNGLLLGESSCSLLVGQPPSQRLVLGALVRQCRIELFLAQRRLRRLRLLRARRPLQASQRNDGIGQLALKCAGHGGGFRCPRLTLFLDALDSRLGIRLGRALQVVGELQNAPGLGKLLFKTLLLTGRVRQFFCELQFASALILEDLDRIGRSIVARSFERSDGIVAPFFERLSQCRRLRQLHVAATDVLSKFGRISNTTTVGVAVRRFGFLPRVLDLREASLQLDASRTFLLDGGLQ